MNYKDAVRYFDYNHGTGELRNKITRSKRAKIGSLSGNIHKKGINVLFNLKRYKAHRIIWLMVYGDEPTDEIDHIDGNPLNNRIDNLRMVNHSENMKNQKMYSSNASGIVGVDWVSKLNKWRVRVSATHIGVFDTLLDAVCARKIAEYNFGFHQNHGR